MTAAPAPTTAERFFFDNNGYLLLEDFLPPALTARLLGAVEKTIEHRRSPAYTRERPTAFKEQLEGRNARLFHLLDADPVFLEMLDYPPMMAYVHGLLNVQPHLHSTDVIYEVERPPTTAWAGTWTASRPGIAICDPTSPSCSSRWAIT